MMKKLFIYFCIFSPVYVWAQRPILLQDFSGSNNLDDYVSETPGVGQFDRLELDPGRDDPMWRPRWDGHDGNTSGEISSEKLRVSIQSGWVIYEASGQGIPYSLNAVNSDFSASRSVAGLTAYVAHFNFSKNSTSGRYVDAGSLGGKLIVGPFSGSFYIGDEYYYSDVIDLPPTGNTFSIGGQSFSGEHKISVACNSSETTLFFQLGGSYQSLPSGRAGLYIDNQLIQTRPAPPIMYDFRCSVSAESFGFTGIPYTAPGYPEMPTYTVTFDNFLIEDYSPYAVVTGPEGYEFVSGTLYATGIVNDRYKYSMEVNSPTRPGQKAIVEIYYTGTLWVCELIDSDPSGRTSGPVVLATNASQSSPSAPCSGWTNGFSLQGNGCYTSLPVSLVSFTGEVIEENQIQLTWATTSETNSDRFDIEHSSDARHWRRVGSVDARGESNKLVNYAYIHTHPIKGNNYYRLVQTDRDGTFTYSRIISLRLAGALAVYPNPATDRIYVGDPENLKGVEVTDAQGRVAVRQTRNLAEGVLLKGLSPGLFFLTTEDISGRKQTVKFLLQP